LNTFTLKLLDTGGERVFDDVVSFVGTDQTGSFGILANHTRTIASLVVGLARFRLATGDWHYLALPGATLYFEDNVLSIATQQALVDDDYERISAALREQLLAEEEKLASMKQSLHRMEEEIFKRLWEMGRAGVSQP
jgi:F-type H+-transporting ATPase subunit epsilon